MRNTTYIAPSLPGAPPSPQRSHAWALALTAVAILPLLLLTASSSFAGSATWLASPISGDWNTPANWTAGGPPGGVDDTATFASSTITGVSISFATLVNGAVFNAGGSAFIITINPFTELTFSGLGITNNSGIAQNFVIPTNEASEGATLVFTGNATAGSDTSFTTSGGSMAASVGSTTNFSDTSTAGNANFTNNGGTAVSAYGGDTVFSSSSSADNGVFTNNGSAFSDLADDDNAGRTIFHDTATAANATLISNSGVGAGGSIQLFDASTGGMARVEVFGNGNLDISSHNAPGVTTGSIEGNGLVFLGAFKLTVGSNNLSTIFSGIIQDGGVFGGTGGSLTKTGTGTLTLAGANAYTGGTMIQGGELLVTANGTSATGTGAVRVNAGTLAGMSRLSGAITVGRGSGAGATLAPGVSGPGVLTTRRTLTFNSDATYVCELTTTNRRSDQVVAKGVTINTGALFSFVSIGNRAIPAGTIFTVINNTAATPIVGTFSNLADNSTFTAGRNTYLVSYEGGTGNDLTLTVQ